MAGPTQFTAEKTQAATIREQAEVAQGGFWGQMMHNADLILFGLAAAMFAWFLFSAIVGHRPSPKSLLAAIALGVGGIVVRNYI